MAILVASMHRIHGQHHRSLSNVDDWMIAQWPGRRRKKGMRTISRACSESFRQIQHVVNFVNLAAIHLPRRSLWLPGRSALVRNLKFQGPNLV